MSESYSEQLPPGYGDTQTMDIHAHAPDHDGAEHARDGGHATLYVKLFTQVGACRNGGLTDAAIANGNDQGQHHAGAATVDDKIPFSFRWNKVKVATRILGLLSPQADGVSTHNEGAATNAMDAETGGQDDQHLSSSSSTTGEYRLFIEDSNSGELQEWRGEDPNETLLDKLTQLQSNSKAGHQQQEGTKAESGSISSNFSIQLKHISVLDNTSSDGLPEYSEGNFDSGDVYESNGISIPYGADPTELSQGLASYTKLNETSTADDDSMRVASSENGYRKVATDEDDDEEEEEEEEEEEDGDYQASEDIGSTDTETSSEDEDEDEEDEDDEEEDTSNEPPPEPPYGLRSYSSANSGRAGGITGLGNLGNTCFMNSALQCLSNTTSLTEYFLSGKWKEELNTTNPLGMKGMVAEAYADLIEHLWDISGTRSTSFSPRHFKGTIGSFNSTFAGYGQQDSQELLGFLLDGLHEDLNRIKSKPFLEMPDMTGQPDEICAKKAWELYGKRNDSIIVDLFQGQYKSSLECCRCSNKSVTFDPYMFLSLPIPDNTKYLYKVFVVDSAYNFGSQVKGEIYGQGQTPIRPILIELIGSKEMTFADGGKIICEKLGWDSSPIDIPDSNGQGQASSPFWVAEMYKAKIHKVYKTDDRMFGIARNDEVYFFYLGDRSGLKNKGSKTTPPVVEHVWEKLTPTGASVAETTLTPVPVFSVTENAFHEEISYSNDERWKRLLGLVSVISVPTHLECTITSERGNSEPARTPVTTGNGSKKRTASTCKIDNLSQLKRTEPFQIDTSNRSETSADYSNVADDGCSSVFESPTDHNEVANAETGDSMDADSPLEKEIDDNVDDSSNKSPEPVEAINTTPRIGEIEQSIGTIIYKQISNALLKTIKDSDMVVPLELLTEDKTQIRNDLFKVYYIEEIKKSDESTTSKYYRFKYGKNEEEFFTTDWLKRGQSDFTNLSIQLKKHIPEEGTTNYTSPSLPSYSISTGYSLNTYGGSNEKTKLTLLYDSSIISKQGKRIGSPSYNGRDTNMIDSDSDVMNYDEDNVEPKKKFKKISFEFSKNGMFVLEWDLDLFQKLYEGESTMKNAFFPIKFDSTPSSTGGEEMDSMSGSYTRAQSNDILGKTALPSDKVVTLMDCINEFGKVETLSGRDTWYCPKCKEHVQANKKLDIWSIPDILVFHLKRFSNSRSSSIYSGRSFNDKIDILVDAPTKALDLSNVIVGNNKMNGTTSEDEDNHDCIYDLYAVSNHYGGLGGGHYTAYGKNVVDGKWYDFDDSRVSPTNENEILTRNAYMLFYRRRGTSDFVTQQSQQAHEFQTLLSRNLEEKARLRAQEEREYLLKQRQKQESSSINTDSVLPEESNSSPSSRGSMDVRGYSSNGMSDTEESRESFIPPPPPPPPA